jgi:kynurenine formamidase
MMSRDYKLIDVSHTVEHGMITYKGLPAPVISDYLSRDIGKIEMIANTGTYLDSPFHRYARGKDLAGLDLNSIANVDGVVVRCTGQTEITESFFSGIDVRDKAVLVHTGWDKHWRTDEYSSGNHPFLTEGAATHLAKNAAALVGIDSFNIDATRDGNRPAHTVLLGHDIPIVEHLCGLEELPDRDFRFFAVPVKVRQFGTFPVRAIAVVTAD